MQALSKGHVKSYKNIADVKKQLTENAKNGIFYRRLRIRKVSIAMKRLRKIVVWMLAAAMLTETLPVGAAENSADVSVQASADEKYFQTKLPRYETPSSDNPYYFSMMNAFEATGYFGMPNCTAYAWGRAYEYYGTRPGLSTFNAGEWWTDNINWGVYEYGSEPRVGAVAVWDKWDQDEGHVAFVEAIDGDNIVISESAWQGVMFRTRTIKKDSSNYLSGGTYRFLGYIYVDQAYQGRSSLPGERWRLYDSVNARYGAGVSYGTWLRLPSGAELDITETKQADGYLWGKFTYSGVTAWCILNYAVCISNPNQTPDPPEEDLKVEEDRVVDTTSGINLRRGPGTKYEVVTWLPNKTHIKVEALAYGAEYTWAKIQYEGVEGWCVYDYTRAYDPAIDGDSSKEDSSSGGSDSSKEDSSKEDSSGNDSSKPEEDKDPLLSVPVEERPILKISSRGEHVTALQEALNQLGYESGSADGIFGAATVAAVKKFQQEKSLTSDGIVGQATWKALYAAVEGDSNNSKPDDTTKPDDGNNNNNGNTGSEEIDTSGYPMIYRYKTGATEYVKKLQERLNALGYDCGAVDGVFGTGTYDQVIAFQKDHALDADGIVGQDSWAALYKKDTDTKPDTPDTPTPSEPEEDYSSYPLLYRYKSGVEEYVKKLQERLNALGYDCGTVDGVFGSGTHNQVLAFQKAQGLTADGYVGQATWAALYKKKAEETPSVPETPKEDYASFPMIRRSQTGVEEYVKKLQERLNTLGYDCGAVDGIFGSGTYNQVLAFQKAKNLTADGIVGQATWAALYQ